MQRVRYAVFDRVLRGREGLPEHLSAEYLGASDVAAVAAEDIVFDALELQERDQVCENGMHCACAVSCRFARRRPQIPVPLTNTASSLARKSTTFATSTGSPSRFAADDEMQKSRKDLSLRKTSRLVGGHDRAGLHIVGGNTELAGLHRERSRDRGDITLQPHLRPRCRQPRKCCAGIRC